MNHVTKQHHLVLSIIIIFDRTYDPHISSPFDYVMVLMWIADGQ